MVKNPPVNAGDATDMGSIPGWGKSPVRGTGPFLYSLNPVGSVQMEGSNESTGIQFQKLGMVSVYVKTLQSRVLWLIWHLRTATHSSPG